MDINPKFKVSLSARKTNLSHKGALDGLSLFNCPVVFSSCVLLSSLINFYSFRFAVLKSSLIINDFTDHKILFYHMSAIPHEPRPYVSFNFNDFRDLLPSGRSEDVVIIFWADDGHQWFLREFSFLIPFFL